MSTKVVLFINVGRYAIFTYFSMRYIDLIPMNNNEVEYFYEYFINITSQNKEVEFFNATNMNFLYNRGTFI